MVGVEIIEIEHIEQFYMVADMFEEYGDVNVNCIYAKLKEFDGDMVILELSESGEGYLAMKPYGEFEESVQLDADIWVEIILNVNRVVRLTAKTI